MYHSKNQWEEETLECDDVSKTSSDISFWMGEFPLSTNQSTIISLIIMTSFSPKMHFFSALDSGVSGTPHKINFQKLSPNTNALLPFLTHNGFIVSISSDTMTRRTIAMIIYVGERESTTGNVTYNI